MPGLVIKLCPKERFMINGVVLQNGEKRSNIVVISEDVNVLRLKDALHPDQVNTPVSRVYYIAQLVLACEADPKEATYQILRGIEQLSQVFTDADSQDHLSRATQNISEGKFYHGLKNLRALISREKRMLSMVAS